MGETGFPQRRNYKFAQQEYSWNYKRENCIEGLTVNGQMNCQEKGTLIRSKKVKLRKSLWVDW